MRALIQRTSGARVTAEDRVVGEIGVGLVVFVCAMRGDGEAESEWLARKTANLRIFRDEQGRMNRSLLDVGGWALIISQFTLAAETKGNRPGFSTAAPPDSLSGNKVTCPRSTPSMKRPIDISCADMMEHTTSDVFTQPGSISAVPARTAPPQL